MAGTLGSQNPFPSILIVEGTEPASPSAGQQRVYIDSTSHHLSRTDSGGTEKDLEAGAGATTTTPTIRAIGSSASGTGAVVPGLPAGHVINDINVAFVQSDNQTITAPAGWTQLGPQVGLGTAAAASATRGAMFWRRDTGADSDPTFADTGDHTLAVIMGVVGCPTTGDPFVMVGNTRKATATTTGTGSAGATDTDHCLIVQAFFHALDSATAVFSAWTNASLTSVTEQIDVATADGNGGGIGVATGILATAGPFVATTVTETSTVDTGSTFYMVPADRVETGAAAHIDRQVFFSGADTWTKPSGAKHVKIIGIGGGGSGSAGRAAATAAGGGGGGGAMWQSFEYGAAQLPATLTVTPGAGGAATANADGTIGNNGTASTVSDGTRNIFNAGAGSGGGVSATGSGGAGGAAGGYISAGGAASVGSAGSTGGAGGTTAAAGWAGADFGGGSGAGGGTTQAASAGGAAARGGAGGGGGRANTNVGTGGASIILAQLAGGATVGANGQDSPYPEFGGSGAAGGTSAVGPGGAGGWPGGGGGGGGTVSSVAGGAGGSGVIVIVTYF